jgi:enamine deaminase RidA (YjgF/YER057c/UK114 family)
MPAEKQAINPAGLFDGPSVGISQAVRAGDTLYCSGQVAFADTLEEQARGAFANLKALLEAAGATMSDIVKMTMYTTEDDCWERTKDIRAEYLPAPFPAATLVGVRALASPALKIEVDVTAVIGSGRPS